MRTPAAAALLAITAAALPALAQPARGTAPLSGPSVQEQPRPRSLIERDFSGKLKRLDVPPEEAAVPLLTLDEATTEKITNLTASRAEAVDKFVSDNLDLIIQLTAARQSGDRAAQIPLLEEIDRKLPAAARGKLGDEIRALLPPDQARRFDTLVNEYRRAAIDDDIADAQSRGEKMTRFQAIIRENLGSIGLQIKRSYERTIAARAADFEQLIGQLGLNPEQDAKIRGMVADYVQQTKGKPTPEQRRDLFLRIMAQLDPQQQRTLLNAYLGKQG